MSIKQRIGSAVVVHACPDCDAPLDLVVHPDGHAMQEIWPSFCTATTRPYLRPLLVPFVACSCCEYCALASSVTVNHWKD